MVKPPKIRHSKSRKDPVTIDLGPEEVSRVPDDLRADGDPAVVVDDQPAPPSSVGGAWTEDTASDMHSQPDADATAQSAEQHAGPADSTDVPIADQTADLGDRAEDGASMNATGQPAPAAEDAPGTSASAASPAAARPAQTTSRGTSPLVAGLLGALIAVGLAGGLQWAGVLGAPTRDASDSEALSGLRGEIAELRTELGDRQPDDRVDSLTQAISGLRTDLDALRGQSGDGGALDALNARIAEIDGRLSALGQAGDGPSAEDIQALSDRIGAADEASRQAGEQVGAIGQRIDALESAVTALTQRVETAAAQPKMAVAIAASALKSAVDRGQPFSTELDTYAAVAPDSPGLEQLRSMAAEGVPSLADLTQRAPDAVSAMIAADRPTDPNQGFFDRLMSSANSLVEVRPVGSVDGTDTAAIGARIEDAVKKGDLTKAAEEYEALPEPAKQAGSEFIAAIKARQAADDLVSRAVADAIKAQAGEG